MPTSAHPAHLPEDSLGNALRTSAELIAEVVGGTTLTEALARLWAARPATPAGVRGAILDLTYGTLRDYGRQDFILGKLLQKPLPEPAQSLLRVALLTGLGGMVVLAFFNSLVAFLLYLFLGLPFPALMAVVAFSVTLIPLVGSVLFWAVGTVVALIASPIGGLTFAIAYLVYMQIEAYVLTPKVMNKAISVPGSLVVIGALVGGTLMGLLGALVAIPVTASILLIIKKVYIPKQDAQV